MMEQESNQQKTTVRDRTRGACERRALSIQRLVASKNCAMSSPTSSNTATVRYRRLPAWKHGTIGDALTTCVMARLRRAARLRAAPMPPSKQV